MKKLILKIEKVYPEEFRVIKEALEREGLRVVKGFNSAIVAIDGGLKKSSNKYLKLLKALAVLDRKGYKDMAKIIKF